MDNGIERITVDEEINILGQAYWLNADVSVNFSLNEDIFSSEYWGSSVSHSQITPTIDFVEVLEITLSAKDQNGDFEQEIEDRDLLDLAKKVAAQIAYREFEWND